MNLFVDYTILMMWKIVGGFLNILPPTPEIDKKFSVNATLSWRFRTQWVSPCGRNITSPGP